MKESWWQIVKDEPAEIESLLRKEIANPEVEAIIVNGGTGISPRDGTYEVIVKLLDKKLDGFGEVFRFLTISRHWLRGDHEPGDCRFGARESADFVARFSRRGGFGVGKIGLARAAPHGFPAPGNMKIKVKFFAILRERAGAGAISKEINDGSTIAQLWQSLQERLSKTCRSDVSFALRGQPKLCDSRAGSQRW